MVRHPLRSQVVSKLGRGATAVEHLRALDLQWPVADFDVGERPGRCELMAARVALLTKGLRADYR